MYTSHMYFYVYQWIFMTPHQIILVDLSWLQIHLIRAVMMYHVDRKHHTCLKPNHKKNYFESKVYCSSWLLKNLLMSQLLEWFHWKTWHHFLFSSQNLISHLKNTENLHDKWAGYKLMWSYAWTYQTFNVWLWFA